MITVAILINDECIGKKSARRIKPGFYETDCGFILKHNYDDGAVVLSRKMLNHLEVKTPVEKITAIIEAAGENDSHSLEGTSHWMTIPELPTSSEGGI